jgi:omega-amidase
MAPVTFTLIQTALHWEDKAANLRLLEEKIMYIKEPTQIVVLPEMFSTGFSMKPEVLAEPMDGPTMQWMKNVAAAKRIILTGSIIIEEGGNYYNRAVWMQPNGQCGYYNKRHLFAYAGEDKHYTAGTQRFIASVNGWRVAVFVCYDLRFPVWCRQQFDAEKRFEYDIALYVANWPQRRSAAWKTLLQGRAIENQCYVIGVNRVGEDGNGIYYSGDSMVVDPLGEILYQKTDAEDSYTITLEKNALQTIREKFPFWRDADTFQIEL